MRTALVLSLLLLLPAAQAGGVYATDTLVDAPPTGTTLYEATDKAPAGDPVSVYLATSPGTLTYTTQWDYAVQQPFSVAGSQTLTFYVSCDVPTVVRPGADNPANPVASARGALAKGGTVVAEANLFELRTCDGSSDIWEAVFALDVPATDFGPGDVLNLQLLLWAPTGGAGTEAHNVHVLVGDAFRSGLVGAGLPGDTVAAPSMQVVHQNLTGATALVEHDWASPKNASFVYNWTAPGDEVVLSLGVSPSQGNVTVTVVDGNGTLHEATYDDNTTELSTLGGGDWVVTVDYADYVGTLRLHAAAAPPAGDDDGNGTAPPDDGNETAEPDSNDSPALPLFVVAAALVVAAARRRR